MKKPNTFKWKFKALIVGVFQIFKEVEQMDGKDRFHIDHISRLPISQNVKE